MIKNQIDKPNSSKCNISILFKYNSTKQNSEYNREKPSRGGEATTYASEFVYDWDGSKIKDVPIGNWDLANSDPDAVSAANENLQDKESLGKRFTRIARGLGNAAKTLVSKFGNNSPKTEASPQYNDEWSGSGEYTPPTDTWDTGGYDTGADSFGEPYDFGEEPSPVAETGGSKLRSQKVLSSLGSLGRRGFGIIAGNKTEGLRSAARGVAETVQATEFGETASDLLGQARASVDNYVNDPETREAATTYALSLGSTVLIGSGVIKETKHWGGVNGTGLRPSLSGSTRAIANPFGAVSRGVKAGGEKVVSDFMSGKGNYTEERLAAVQTQINSISNPFLKFGANRAFNRMREQASKNGYI